MTTGGTKNITRGSFFFCTVDNCFGCASQTLFALLGLFFWPFLPFCCGHGGIFQMKPEFEINYSKTKRRCRFGQSSLSQLRLGKKLQREITECFCSALPCRVSFFNLISCAFLAELFGQRSGQSFCRVSFRNLISCTCL